MHYCSYECFPNVNLYSVYDYKRGDVNPVKINNDESKESVFINNSSNTLGVFFWVGSLLGTFIFIVVFYACVNFTCRCLFSHSQTLPSDYVEKFD
jgi:hypothetical protein